MPASLLSRGRSRARLFGPSLLSRPEAVQVGREEAGDLRVPGGQWPSLQPWWPGGSGCGQSGAEFLWLENEHKRTNAEGCTMLMRHSPGHSHGAVPHHHCLGPGREQRGAWRLMAELIAPASAGSSLPRSPNSHYSSRGKGVEGGCTSLLD